MGVLRGESESQHVLHPLPQHAGAWPSAEVPHRCIYSTGISKSDFSGFIGKSLAQDYFDIMENISVLCIHINRHIY